MYCTSNELLKKIQVYIDKIEEKSDGLLSFEEYISLPYFGNIILRFNINKENYTLEDLDKYETFIQEIVQDEFLVDFMGSVYQKVGFEPWMYEEKFKKCYHKYAALPITSKDYRDLLIQDGIFILNKCGLPTDVKVWEIQNDEELILLILDNSNEKIGTFSFENRKAHVYIVEENACIGLMRAAMYAKSKHISLVRVLLEA